MFLSHHPAHLLSSEVLDEHIPWCWVTVAEKLHPNHCRTTKLC